MSHTLFIFLSFAFFTIMVGVISSRLVTSDDQSTVKGYFLAGKGLSGLFIAGSMILTNISAENFVGLSGQAYGANMSGMAWESTAVIATIVMACVFLPIYLRKGYTTLPEFLEDRYDKTVRRIVSLLFLAGYTFFALPVILYAGALGFMKVFDLGKLFGVSQSTAFTILIVALGVIGALYAVLGGLKAVAVSDTINGVILLVTSLLIPFFALYAVGKLSNGGIIAGLEHVVTVNPEKLSAIGGINDPVPFTTIFTGMIFANLFYWGTNQVLIQRVLGAKNLAEGQKGVLLTGFIKILIPLVLVFPGVLAFHLIKGLPNADLAYSALVSEVLPWPVVGMFCAGLFGAVISTYNSLINSASTLFMLDIYKPLINNNITDQEVVKKAKIFGTILAVFAICVAPVLQNAGGIYNFSRGVTGFYNMPIITVVLWGMFSKRASAKAVKVAVAFHLIFYSLTKYILKLDTANNIIGVKIPFVHIFFISVCIMSLLIYVLSGIYKNNKVFDNSAVIDSSYDMRPWRYTKSICASLVAILVYVYLMLSPLGIATETKNMTLIVIWNVCLVVILAVCAIKAKSTNKNI